MFITTTLSHQQFSVYGSLKCLWRW